MADDENAGRRSEEREALEAFYGDKATGPPEGPWRISLGSACQHRQNRKNNHKQEEVILQLELPAGYPSAHTAPTPTVQAHPSMVAPARLRALEAELQAMHEPDVEASILWAEHVRAVLGLEEVEANAEGGEDDDENSGDDDKPPSLSETKNGGRPIAFYACLRTHHLLDHKPDHLLRTEGHKHGLVGWYRFGTPGIALAWYRDSSCWEGFASILRRAMPQKKIEVVFQRPWDQDLPSAWEETKSAKDLRGALEMLGAPPQDYFVILGLDPSSSFSSNAFATNGGPKPKGKKR